MRGTLPDAAWREKRSPPRPLTDIADALYAPALAGASTAWLAWMPGDPARWSAALAAVLDRAARDGARRLAVGGPPGNYLASGVDADDSALRAFFEANGFAAEGEHRELTVTCSGHAWNARVTRCEASERAALLRWIAERFSGAWSMEAERAFAHRGLFAARDGDGSFTGFAAHSGNRAWEATFGPVGVASERRGAGLGYALTAAVLADLSAAGHRVCTVPWVDVGTARFYRTRCEVVAERVRIEYRRDLAPPKGAEIH